MSSVIFGYAVKPNGEYRGVLSDYPLAPDEVFYPGDLPNWVKALIIP